MTVSRPSYAALQSGHRTPSDLVVRAAARARTGRALDVGCGALRNTEFLLGAGFAVDAVDRDPVVATMAARMHHPRLRFVHARIEQWSMPKATYTLVAAIHVLPMLPPDVLGRVLASIRSALVVDGLLGATLLGDRDGWAGDHPLMTFVSRTGCADLLRGFEVRAQDEIEYDGLDATGAPKHWHVHRLLCSAHPTC
ncbi:class I SAM-dependent methyltransferase [Pseudonocardia sp. GCM10023141]|uniref:class I SAM-dependent methyltransferase n=1 Tax=Pseudonocardia sp. GCM10023141 TaxID=3252653 RepID=UPI0036155194